MAGTSQGPQLTWANIIGTLVAFIALAAVAGAWVKDQRDADRTLFNSQIDSFKEAEAIRHRDVSRREDELRDEIKRIKDELMPKLVIKDSFNVFEKSMDDRWRTQADINKQAIDAYLASKVFQAWKDERDKTLSQMQSRIERLENK